MPEYATFEHFARDLFLNSNLRHFEISSSDREKLPPCTVFSHHASSVLVLFSGGHFVPFENIFVKTEKQVLHTDEQFFKFVIPRCLNLIDNDRYFYSLMLVAGFLKRYVNFLRDTRVCYRFHFIAYKCLAAVFERSFKNSFESNGGWNGFGKYLKHVDEAYAASEDLYILTSLNEGDPFLLKKVKMLIKHCDDISDDFNLNEYEISLLKDDDIKDIQESLDYSEADEDPLNLSWPPDDEVVKEKLMQDLEDRYAGLDLERFIVTSDYLNRKKGMDDSEEVRYPSILSDYIYLIEGEAEMRLGTEKFLEKMKLRLCPCCGIKCYQFSKKLLTKQIDLATTNKALGNVLERKAPMKAKL